MIMNQEIVQILSVAAGIYFVMGVILVVFAEPIYLWARNSEMPVFTKGLFARAITSYYNIKTKGLSAGWSHWGYCLGFNAGVSITVSLIIAIGLTLIAIALSIVALVVALQIIGFFLDSM